MPAFGRAYELQLRALVNDLFATLDGIQEEDFNTWKPAAAREGGHEMNTFAALAIHTVSAAEFMTLHAVGGQPSRRNREAEFEATGSLDEIKARFETWLEGVHELMANFADADLDRESHSVRYTERNWKTAEVLLHALDHTALHLGHLQVQRQLWEAERAN
jgi:hypothetical protein